MDVIYLLSLFAAATLLPLGYSFTGAAIAWWLYDATPRTRLHGTACIGLGVVWPLVLLGAVVLAAVRAAQECRRPAVPRARVVRR